MSRWGIVLGLLGCGLSAEAQVRRFALVVGSNVGDGVEAAPLQYADDDAVAMHELLLEAGVESTLLVSFDDDTRRLHPLTAAVGPATRERLFAVFDAQRARMAKARAAGEEVEWLFFFSGHGDVDRGEGFLGLERGRLTRRELHEELLARSGASRMQVIIDACKSAFLVSAKGVGGHRHSLNLEFAAAVSPAGQVGFLVSASAARDSHEWERLQSGVFSYEVRSALRGSADVDRDGVVTYAEVGAFLRTANEAIANRSLRPDFLILPPAGGLSSPVLRWPDGRAVVADVALGHVYVERPSGERLLDLHPTPGLWARLFLPTERPLFFRTADGQREVELSSEEQLSVVRPVQAQVRSRGALSLAFEQLFARPFGAAEVSGFAGSWAAPDLSKLELVLEPSWRAGLKRASGWTATGGAALAVASFAIGWGLQLSGLPLSQTARASRNGQISTLNAVGVGAAMAGALGAIIWAWLTVKPYEPPPMAFGLADQVSLMPVCGVWQ